MIDSKTKFRFYTEGMLEYALKDCHATLAIHGYTDSAYVRKLWAEIDAIRDTMMVRNRAAKSKPRTEAKVLADYYASIL